MVAGLTYKYCDRIRIFHSAHDENEERRRHLHASHDGSAEKRTGDGPSGENRTLTLST